jgi:hypothetical protein
VIRKSVYRVPLVAGNLSECGNKTAVCEFHIVWGSV